MRVVAALSMAWLLGGCGVVTGLSTGASAPFSGQGTGLRGSVQEVEGVRFRTRISAPREDRRRFSTSTRGAAQAPLAATEAGRLEAVGYCLRTFGGSQIVWSIPPASDPGEVAISGDGSLVLRGRCVAR
jgi:hypothetical protein